MRTQRDRHRGVDPGKLLDGDRVGQRISSGASQVLGIRDAHQIELTETLDDLVRKALGAVEMLGDGGDLALGEVADRLP